MPIVAFAASALTATEEQASRTWEFKLRMPGTYKVQVEHDLNGIEPGSKTATYSIRTAEKETRRQLDLIVGQPFIPLIVDVPNPQTMRMSVAGLSEPALQHTRVQVYDASFQNPAEYVAATAQPRLKEIDRIRETLSRSPADIDLARVKFTIDQMVDPAIDVEASLKALEAIVGTIRAMPNFGPDSTSKMLALKRYLYTPGGWNGFKAYEYDLADPLGTKISNKLLPNYIGSRKGNCVTMPFLFVVLGQRLGIDVAAATAPLHFFVKFRDDAGNWHNLESTSGANPARDVWYREQMPMTDEAIANGVYLQPLTKKQTVAVMATVLAEHYFEKQEYEKASAIAGLTLEYYPKYVGAMTMEGAAAFRTMRTQYMSRYPTPAQIPVSERGRFQYLSRSNQYWFAKAEALGWREPPKEDEQKYLQKIDQARQRPTPNN